jgi:N-ethylmaleimide reductase
MNGGSIENKARIFFEVLDAVKEVIPEEKLSSF